MKGFHFFGAMCCGYTWVLMLLAGCSESGVNHAVPPMVRDTGTVRVMLTATPVPTTGAVNVPIQRISLLPTTLPATGTPQPGIINILDREQWITLLSGPERQPIEITTTQVPVGDYTAINVALDLAAVQSTLINLPFNVDALNGNLPIEGGMRVTRDAIITLVIDLFSGEVVANPINSL